MRLVKLGIANVNPTVGAVRSNVDRVIEIAGAMSKASVTIAAFPEQVVGGYAAEDLVQWRGFVDTQWAELHRMARETAASPTVFVVGVTAGIGGDLFNSAAVIHRGTILGLVPKEKLPTYNVFYEARTFSRGTPHLELDKDEGRCAARRLPFRFRFRHARRGGLRRHLVAGRANAAALL
jgi:NAD+ synthase (glutamine-hydrolysing)